MISSFISSIRTLQYSGLNTLEWFGIISGVSILFYSIFTLRDLLSVSGANKAQRKTLLRTNPEIPRKAEMKKDLPHGDETILIVDDDAAVLKAHARLVAKLGYQVERAVGGQAAIDYVHDHHADLIVLDLLMPELDGIETFRAIKKINPLQRAIVLSGFAGPAMVNAIKSLGVGSYLVKPAQVSILAKAIRDELDREEES